MQSLFDQGPADPAPEPFNMAAWVLGRADAQPQKPALEILSPSGVDIWTYGGLKSAVLGTATGLLEQGLKPGDHVLMRLGNTVDFPVVFLAAIACGGIPVPASAQLTSSEISAISKMVKPSLIVAATGVSLPDPLECPVITSAQLGAMQQLPPASFHMASPERPAYVVFTSGTSGRPRGVVHAHRAVWARQMMWQGWYGLSAHDRVFHAGAFNWTYTLGAGLMDPWAAGATALIAQDKTPVSELAQLIGAHRVSIFAAAPGVYRQMLKAPMPAVPTLRHGLSAGEKLAQSIRADWEHATGTQIYEAFGMSECSTFISGAPGRPAPPESLGFPQAGRRVAILNGAQIAPLNTQGDIAINRRDPGLMLGYLGDPEASAQKYRGEWFITGDMGQMDESGAVRYLGRGDDMMNAGGFRVSPLEVEAVMRGAHGVTDCAAVEIQVRKDASVIALCYTSPSPLSEAHLQDHARLYLARYKQPRAYVHLSDLPRGVNGKLLRKLLRQQHSKFQSDGAGLI